MQINNYALPELSMVGGSTLEFCLHMTDEFGVPVSLVNTTLDFAVCEYSDRTTPLFMVTPTTELDNIGVTSVVRVVIPAINTKSLYGKYVYQITIVDNKGKVGIPSQGIINIFKNIHPMS